MTDQGNGQPLVFQVRASKLVWDRLKQLHKEEAQADRGHRFLIALRFIRDRLRNEPGVFGEPLYHLPALQLQVRQGAIYPLVVDYAVHAQERIVFIRGFNVLL